MHKSITMTQSKGSFSLAKFSAKMPEAATAAELTVASLGDRSQIELTLSVLCHPKNPR